MRLSNLQDEAWGGVDVQLKRRFDLVPNLVETVKRYASHEQAAFQKVIEAHGTITGATSRYTRIDAESALSATLQNLLAVAESYPDLKANNNFNELQRELSSLDNELRLARRYYNGSVRDFNISVQSFPTVLISRNLGYREAKMFEAGDDAREGNAD
jgi:LemA protein